jgi:hypothetical protein
LRPFVSATVRDLDLDRLGLRKLRDRYFKHAVLVRGLDRVVTDIARKPEGPMDPAATAFRAMNPRVLGPRWLVALGVDDQRPVLDLESLFKPGRSMLKW